MKNLIELNPGFESRIQFTINFPDYSAEEYLNDDENDYEDLNGYNDIE